MASIGSNSSVQAPDVAVAHADIVVALTSYNDVRTIGAVTRSVQEGLARYLGSSTARIVLADAQSTDGTLDAAREAAGTAALVEVAYPAPAALGDLPYHGHPGRAAALRAILQTAQRLGANACAVLDAGLDAANPEWIERLITPVLVDRFDYVAPYYARRANEGAITKGIVYPMFRALYGARLRQPAAGEFGCSARVVAHVLEQDFWDLDQAHVGIDLWLASAAVCGGFSVCEAPLGVRVASHDAPADVSTILAQIVGALFTDLERRVDVWQRTRTSLPIPILGSMPDVKVEPSFADVDALIQSFRLGYRELREIWTFVLPPRTIVELRKLTETVPARFHFDDRLWATVVFDFALGYSLRVMPHDHLLRSLMPLYAGWLASFFIQVKGATLAEVDQRVEQLCLGFEAEKRYLIARWRWPERLR
jgi:glycosyltransferase involved in cell wall biosynthesis